MEVHGFNESGTIDVSFDSIRMTVPDDMSNRHRYQIWAEWEMAPAHEGTPDDERVRVNTIPAYVEPAPEALPYRLYRSTFIERMTPAEAEAMEGVLLAEGAKLRLMYQAVDYFVSDDPLFAVLHWATAVALGEEGEPNIARADELLGPEIQD